MTASAVPTPTTATVPANVITTGANVRFNLKANKVASIASSILSQGLLNSISLEELTEPTSDGALYSVVTGNYRWAALQLNHKNGAAQLSEVEAKVYPPLTSDQRRLLQLTENGERENMTPMDRAVAMKSALAEGKTKIEVREMFPSAGGRKGNKVQPLSNASLNMHLRFLELPKKIQNALHDGTLGVLAAYKLMKRPKDQWDAILGDAEKEAESLDAEFAKDEEKILAEEKRTAEMEEKAKELQSKLEEAKAKISQNSATLDAVAQAEVDAKKALAQGAKDNAEKEAQQKALAESQAKWKETIKATEEAKKEADALSAKLEKHSKLIEERKAKLEAARNAAKSNKKVTAAQVDESAAKAGFPETKLLNAIQMRDAISQWALPGSFPKVQAIFEIVKECFSGVPGCPTPTQAYGKMALVTGEKEAKAPKAKKV